MNWKPLNKHIANTLVGLVLTTNVAAIDPNSDQAINIESDQALLDDAEGISSYNGNVIVSQGLSKLEADRLLVSAKDRRITRIEAWGSPAHFVQQDDATTAATHGYAQSIVFEAKESLLVFTGQARLLQSENSFAGERIEYDIVKKAIRAQGDESIGSRVKIQYFPSPKNKQTNTPSPPKEDANTAP
ncbi:MAG: lipopolysaccharide transport periplasmic protein LptA [Oleiphilaceae bacterium]|nr:lipopolysaccharide transport periplasmic protein LptA [Oleiphilaceae bacterium]